MAINFSGLHPKTERLLAKAFGTVSYPNGEGGMKDVAGVWLRNRGLTCKERIHDFGLAAEARAPRYIPHRYYQELVLLSRLNVTEVKMRKYVHGTITLDQLMA